MDDLQEELDALERILCGQKEPDSLDFRLLRRLTGNFSDDRRIGEGGCGEVYKGFLPNGKVIAVKKLKKDHVIDDKIFRREVDSMIKVRHQNIVRFLGYCSEIKEKAVLMDDGNFVMAEERVKLLCFPYISNGSLDKHLTDELRGFEWHTRYQIIKGICDGLLHLHKEKGIMHMDLKPANILLGDEMSPKITDFGVSRIDGKTQITSAERLFSRGHAAPEYIDTGVRSWKSDIYSLGVIIIELVTGSRKIPNTTKVLRRWRHRWNKSSKHTPLSYLQVKKCLELAVSCQEINPVNRPFIWDVVRELNELDSWDGQTTESSLEKIISSSDDMLGIEPLELYFPLGHEKQASCSTELTNDTDYYMAFRIATTSLLPFSIQPDKGIAAPGSMCRITIILPAQEMVTRLKNHGEGFIVQSTRVDGSPTDVDITDVTFNDEGGYSQKKIDDGDKVVDEVTLTVLFDILHEEHQDQTNLSAEMGSLVASSQEVQKSVESVAGEHPFGEHPCRALFVMNINSNVEDSELRSLFEQYGDIRTLYTASKHMGFVRISYFDIRAARDAMRALQNKPLRSRKLDIHFSTTHQGTLAISNLDPSVSNEEVRQIFGAFGEVKEIRETPNKKHHKHHKFIEFYDVRAAEAALRSLNKSEIAGKRIWVRIHRNKFY